MANSFLSRWSQRKFEQDKSQSEPEVTETLAVDTTTSESAAEQDTKANESQEEKTQRVTDDIEGMGELHSEQSESVASLLATGAEAAVKKAALRKLFLSGEFSEVDALNDYDHDYKAVKSLSSDVASKLRGWAKEQIEEEPELQTDRVVPSEDVSAQTELEGEETSVSTSRSVEQQSTGNESVELHSGDEPVPLK